MSKLTVTDPASIANLARAATAANAGLAKGGAASDPGSAPAIDPAELEHVVRLTLARSRSAPADSPVEALHVDLDTRPHHP